MPTVSTKAFKVSEVDSVSRLVDRVAVHLAAALRATDPALPHALSQRYSYRWAQTFGEDVVRHVKTLFQIGQSLRPGSDPSVELTWTISFPEETSPPTKADEIFWGSYSIECATSAGHGDGSELG